VTGTSLYGEPSHEILIVRKNCIYHSHAAKNTEIALRYYRTGLLIMTADFFDLLTSSKGIF